MSEPSTDLAAAPRNSARSETGLPRVCLIGGAPDTGNLGVSALGTSAVSQLLRVAPSAHVLWQHMSRDGQIDAPSGSAADASVEAVFLHQSNRLRDRRGTRHLSMLGKTLRRLPAALRAPMLPRGSAIARLLGCSVVADISGGDSFADLYGARVFQGQVAMKRLAIDLGLPLIMLPQTFGPFHHEQSQEVVRRILRYASLAATRDFGGQAELAELMGDKYADRLVECPDVAFTLSACAPPGGPEPFVAESIRRGERLVGVNVSGLAYFDGEKFGLSLDYREMMGRIVETAVQRWDARVLLIPHVRHPRKLLQRAHMPGDDAAACGELRRAVGSWAADRVATLEGSYTASEIKWLIGRCDFFVGARMHACIAAVSQGIPTVVQAYSKKADGVMRMAGAGDTVVDLRNRGLEECLADTIERFEQRDALRIRLAEAMPVAKRRVEEFFRDRVAPQIVRSRASAAGKEH